MVEDEVEEPRLLVLLISFERLRLAQKQVGRSRDLLERRERRRRVGRVEAWPVNLLAAAGDAANVLRIKRRHLDHGGVGNGLKPVGLHPLQGDLVLERVGLPLAFNAGVARGVHQLSAEQSIGEQVQRQLRRDPRREVGPNLYLPAAD